MQVPKLAGVCQAAFCLTDLPLQELFCDFTDHAAERHEQILKMQQ